MASKKSRQHKRWNQGESLVECMTSLLVLTILIVTISFAIDFSLSTTVRAMRRATASQNHANSAVLGGIGMFDTATDDCTLSLTFTDEETGADVFSVDIDEIRVITNVDFIAFEPMLSGTGGGEEP